MRKNNSVSIVEKTVKQFGGDRKRLARELKRLVKDGQKAGDLIMLGVAFCNLAELCDCLDDEQGTFSYALKAVSCLKDTNAHEWLARAYLYMGLVYHYQGNFQAALEMDEMAYRLISRHRIQGAARISALNALASNYKVFGDAKKGIRMRTKCLELVETSPGFDLMTRAMYTLNLAQDYRENREPEKAREILLSMKPWIGKIEFQAVVCDYDLRCAITSYLLEDTQQGDAFTDAALALVPRDICPVPVYDDLQELSAFLLARKDRVRADIILDFAIHSAENSKTTLQSIFSYRIMANHYRVFGQPERAAECYSKLVALFDTQKLEMRKTQLEQILRMKAADAEVQKLRREIQKNDAVISQEPMTGLLNRSALLRVSSEFIGSAAEKKQKVGAIFIDIDFFKECNDTYGHSRGDEVIREVARACRNEETKDVRFARYGGDEFFGITRRLSDEEVCDLARRIADRIRHADLPHVSNPNGGRITLSIGVVNMLITDKMNTILDIADNADKALYYAKSAGKNAIYQLVCNTDADGDNATYIRIDF